MSSRLRRRFPTIVPLVVAASCVLAGTWGAHVLADAYADPGGVPRLVPFRGHLESGGLPVTRAVTLEVTVYDAPMGGTRLWGPETHAITPVNGDFTVMLGANVALTPAVVFGGDAWIALSVEGVALAGRQRLASAPYALRAAVSERAETATGALAVDVAQAAPTGSVVMWLASAPPAGWLALDGGTIGGTGSGATALADPSARDLFVLLWSSLDNTVLAIQDASGAPTVRGASADADFAANRRLPLPNTAGLVPRATGTQNVGGLNKVGPALGAAQADQFQGHWHLVRRASNGSSVTANSGAGNFAWSINTLGGTDGTHALIGADVRNDGTNGAPRVGAETRAAAFGVSFIVKL